MTRLAYEFSGGDLFETPHKYTYTSFQGWPFIAAWKEARATIRAALGDAAPPPEPRNGGAAPQGDHVDTAALLEFLAGTGGGAEVSRPWLQWMVQRFEVSKRVHSAYTLVGGRAKGNGDYRNPELYLRLAEVLAREAGERAHLPSLNALLKCLDTLCSYHTDLDEPQRGRLASVLDREKSLVETVGAQAGGPPGQKIDPPVRIDKPLARIRGAAFLATDTMRSRGYAQALAAHGAKLEKVVIVKVAGNALRWGQSEDAPHADASLEGYFQPDLGLPLEDTCRALSDNVEILHTGTVNCAEVIDSLAGDDLDFVIYSGFGGELVSKDVLRNCPPLLHMHAGWLPDYRGSTTTYYSWMREGVCGVSAIFLSPNIDEGAILDRKKYPPPVSGMDGDYLHDSVLRSDLLLSVVKHVAETGSLPLEQHQQSDEGEVYFIIHPVLKHLAILGGAQAQG